jgi:ribosomal protein L31
MIYDVLMADEILISDYNSKNADSFVDISVEINSGYEPNYSGSRPYPSVQIGLVDKFNNRKKLYS